MHAHVRNTHALTKKTVDSHSHLSILSIQLLLAPLAGERPRAFVTLAVIASWPFSFRIFHQHTHTNDGPKIRAKNNEFVLRERKKNNKSDQWKCPLAQSRGIMR